MPELNNKRHEAFCHEYLKDLNATAAYKRVYGEKKNPKTAEVNATKLLGNAKVKVRVKELTDARNERTDCDADAFIKQLEHMAMFDPIEVLDWDGFSLNVRKLEDVPVEARRMITSMKERKEFSDDGEFLGSSLEVKFASKEKVMELFGRHLGVFNDKLQVTNKTVEDIIREAKENTNASK